MTSFSPDSTPGNEAESEMDWLRNDVIFLLREIAALEEANLESGKARQIMRSIIESLREMLHFSRRGEYREPADVCAAANQLEEAARATLARIPRRNGRLKIPMVCALQHVQDFRDAIRTCVAVPDEL